MASYPKSIVGAIEQRNYYMLHKELQTFFKKAIKKYQKGRAEHREDPSDIDYDTEIEQELLDLVIYMLMKRLFKKQIK